MADVSCRKIFISIINIPKIGTHFFIVKPEGLHSIHSSRVRMCLFSEIALNSAHFCSHELFIHFSMNLSLQVSVRVFRHRTNFPLRFQAFSNVHIYIK